MLQQERTELNKVGRLCRLLDHMEGSRIARFLWYSFICAAIVIFSYGLTRAQGSEVGISLSTDYPDVGQGELVQLSVQLDSSATVYYFESEIGFDADRLTLVDVSAGSLLGSEEGIAVGDMVRAGVAGVSASRTSSDTTGTGSLLLVTFRVKTVADTGETLLTLNAPVLKDSQALVISTNSTASTPVHIKPLITAGGLSTGTSTIHEAQSVQLEAFAYAHQVTDVTTPEDSLRVWLGLSTSSADPTTWSEDQWVRADLVRSDQAGNAFYRATFGPALMVGNWYYAARYRLEDNAYRYGGFGADSGAFWHSNTAPAGNLTVNERPPYQHVLALWNFDDRDAVVDQALDGSRNAMISFTGSGLEGFDQRDDGYTMATDGWHMEQGADSLKYIKTRISTINFKNIRVSSSFRGTGSSARDFQLQMSLDDSVWSDVPDGAVLVTEDWGGGTLQELSLPASASNSADLYLRWRRIGDIRVDGTADVSSQGKVRMDDIKVTGSAVDPQRPAVWPGDADNNGSVDMADVLPLGTWWGRQGPDRIVRNISWSGLETIGWFPFEATFADTDGSGIVDQSDLEAIGMNFGQARNQIQTTSAATPLARLSIQPLKQGEQQTIAVNAARPQQLSGLSLQLDWSAQTDKEYAASTTSKAALSSWFSIEPVYDATDWLYRWDRNQSLLNYRRAEANRWSGAWVHKGSTSPRESRRLMRFRIVAKQDWPAAVTFRLNQSRIARPDRPSKNLEDGTLRIGTSVGIADEHGGEETLPSTTLLHPNHPNPFNPATSLRYELANAGNVTLRIFSLLGKRVATLVDNEYQRAGTYAYNWDASGLSSGVYLYVLQTEQRHYTGKMLLMK